MEKIPVRKVSKKTVITVGPNDGVLEAARLMREKDVGSVVVVRGGKPVGILTDRDITVRVVADGRDGGATRVEDVMTGGVITATEDIRAAELVKLIDDYGIRRIPIVDADGMLTGIITLDDILRIVGINVGFKVSISS